ncbi:MAG: hypothetical protein H6817_01180 [Phycisphaerales bacterium]|nr:hypothetical protein [Phycisphaerales bacterium]
MMTAVDLRLRTLRSAVAFCLTLAIVGSQLQAAVPALDRASGEGKALDLCSHERAELLRERFEADLPVRSRAALEADADTDVLHYFLDIEIIPETSGPTFTAVRVEGVSTIDATPTSDGLTEFTVDLHTALTVSTVTGDLASWSRVGATVVITLDHAYDAGEVFEVAISYSGYPDSAGFGAFEWWTRNSNLVVGTLSEPYYARTWWPCKDSLGDKATMQMHVTVPDGLVVASNGIDEGSVSVGGGRTKFMWHETYPMMPYLASLAITNYKRYDIDFDYVDSNGPQTMPVLCYLYPDHWNNILDEPYESWKAGCDELLDMLHYLGDAYGRYPFIAEKYGVAEIGGGGVGANMEHQTISSMYYINNYSDTMAHELAHHWWGDNVTCGTWYDIWLNEGFATYSEAIYRELKPSGGISSYWSRMISRRPSQPNNQVYRTSISSVGAIFSGNDVYNKGSWVLHMLRHVMGDEAFFTALADYRAAYTGGSATTAEFAATISASFGNDLSWFTDEWVMNPGSPRYQWNYASAVIDGQNYLKLMVQQTQNSQGYGLFIMPIDIRVTTGSGTTVHRVWNDAWSEYFVIPIDGAPTLVEFDEDSGVSNYNWILWQSATQTGTVSPPPVLISADWSPFANTGTDSVVVLQFSEDIGSLSAGDVAMVGDSFGVQAPSAVAYNSGLRSATVTFSNLPFDGYTLTLIASGISANSKDLDGEIDDSAWYDTQLLPSGDGIPGGDSVLTVYHRLGDYDGDGDVDAADLNEDVDCLTGPGNYAPLSDCAAFDFDVDGDVDLHDFRAFQAAYDQ